MRPNTKWIWENMSTELKNELVRCKMVISVMCILLNNSMMRFSNIAISLVF